MTEHKSVGRRINDFLKGLGRGCQRLWEAAGAGISRFGAVAGGVLKKVFTRAWFREHRKHVAVAALGLCLLAGGITLFVYYLQITNPGVVLQNPGSGFAPDENVNKQFSESKVNIAVLGFDRNESRAQYGYLFLPDVIMVASIDFKRDTVKFVRVPRDSYVPIWDRNVSDKINHSYYHGYFYGEGEDKDEAGLKTTLQTVSHLLGDVPIHYYVTVCMDGVVQLVDAMGGVRFNVERKVYSTRGKLLLDEGMQQLSGKKFLHYARFREGATGQDIGRIKRQMELLLATFDQFKEQGRFRQIPATYRIYKDYVNTNLSYKQIAALAYYASNFEKTEESVRSYTLSGSNQTRDGIWYYLLNQDHRVELIREVFGLSVPRWPADVLRDTPPPPLKEFAYTVKEAGGRPVVLLTWRPGDSKKVLYDLYRRAEGGPEVVLARSLEESSYRDGEVTAGATYEYRLQVRHYRAEGIPAHLTVKLEKAEVGVTGVALDRGALTLRVGEPGRKLAVTISPADAANRKVSWATGDPAVAAVEGGLVTAVGAGETVITVTTAEGAFTAQCRVTVEAAGSVEEGDEDDEDDENIGDDPEEED